MRLEITWDPNDPAVDQVFLSLATEEGEGSFSGDRGRVARQVSLQVYAMIMQGPNPTSFPD